MSQSASLAMRLQENWMNRHPQDTCHSGPNLDDSLTSLGWLQNLRVSEFTQHRQASSCSAKLDSDRNVFKLEMDPRVNVHVSTCDNSFIATDHRTNLYAKPSYSYASLICMAMKATKTNKITLASIYNWITDNFAYYRHSDPSWQNSIRHNLSLNKCFEKVPRGKDEPGKGGFWRINPEYCDLMEDGILRKRQGSRDSISPPPLKRIKPEDDVTFLVYDNITRAREDRLLSSTDEDIESPLSLRDDFSWTTILNQDIEIAGKSIKTEAILDQCENSPFMSPCPPNTETISDDLGLDFLSQSEFNISLVEDVQTNDPLDLTVQGRPIRPPDWWTPDDGFNSVVSTSSSDDNSGLNTPVPTPSEADQGGIIWGESLKLASSGNSFDLESLFAIDGISSSQQL